MAVTAAGTGLLAHFSALEDPRQSGKVLYPLPEILLVVLCGTLSGCDDFVEMALWGREHLSFLRGFEPFARGIASHDTLNDVVRALDPALFEDCFVSWINSLRGAVGAEEIPVPETIAIDGKTMRRSGSRRGAGPLHLVSAWACGQRLVLAQEAVTGKSNEITAIPRLLDQLVLKGALVTIDAMGCQRAIAEQIVEAEADYVLAIKGNQKSLYGSIQRAIAEGRAEDGFGLDMVRTEDADHGRIEVRRHFILHDVSTLNRRHAWPGLGAVGMVEAEVERDGKTTVTRRCFLCSRPMSAAEFAAVVRSHWQIENSLHWVLDVVFRDDHARVRKGYGARNMGLIKRIAVNLLKSATDKNSLKVRRKKASWSTGYLHSLMIGTA
jgi:predicted transposase YbfD/YdcC